MSLSVSYSISNVIQQPGQAPVVQDSSLVQTEMVETAMLSASVSVATPALVVGTTTYQLPEDGTDGQVFRTDGMGNLTWMTPVETGLDTYQTIYDRSAVEKLTIVNAGEPVCFRTQAFGDTAVCVKNPSNLATMSVTGEGTLDCQAVKTATIDSKAPDDYLIIGSNITTGAIEIGAPAYRTYIYRPVLEGASVNVGGEEWDLAVTKGTTGQVLTSDGAGSTFWTTVGGGGTLQDAYDASTSNPEILTDSTRGGVNIRCGSASNTDIVLSVQNTAGETVSYMSGEGVLTARKTVFKEYHHLPGWDMAGYNKDDVSQYFLRKSQPKAPVKTILKSILDLGLPHGYGFPCYVPYLNRVYLTPLGARATQATWHYYDCNTGLFVEYTHGAHANNVSGGMSQVFRIVFHAGLNRAYLICGHNLPWLHYIDGLTGSVVAYASQNLGFNQYQSACYSPKEQRLYIINANPGNNIFFYIGPTGVQSQLTPLISASASVGASYDATNNRIMIVPFSNSGNALWYYIDCEPMTDNLKVKSYAHGLGTLPNELCYSMSYHPILNRLYLQPWAFTTTMYYIDCNLATPTVVSTPFISPGGNSYIDAFFMPTVGSLFLIPSQLGVNSNTWATIDYQGNVVQLLDTTGAFISECSGGFYDVQNDVSYMLASGNGNHLKLDPITCERIDRFIMASSMMGN
jgi:hypothetical protein